MAKLSPKIVNPISIKVTPDHILLFTENKEKKYELKKARGIKGEHYGFTLIYCIDDIEYEETYPTQAKVNRVELNQGILNVYEFGKYHPWKFNNDGELLENPTIDSIYRIEIEYPVHNDKESIRVYVKK